MPRVLYTVVRYVDSYTVSTSDVIEAGRWKLNHSFLLDISASKTPEKCHCTSEIILTPKTSYPMIKSASEMRVIVLRALMLILGLSKQWLNPDKLKVSAMKFKKWQLTYNWLAVASEPQRPQLKITIPATTSIPSGIPDGDPVESGVLLSASELYQRGIFFHSPSDTAPIPVTRSEGNNDDIKGKTYWPPKHSNALDDEAPKSIYASDGEEVTVETEHSRELVRRHQHGITHCHSSNERLRWTRILEISTHLQQYTKFIEGKDNQNGTTHESMDTEWLVWDDATAWESAETEAWWQQRGKITLHQLYTYRMLYVYRWLYRLDNGIRISHLWGVYGY